MNTATWTDISAGTILPEPVSDPRTRMVFPGALFSATKRGRPPRPLCFRRNKNCLPESRGGSAYDGSLIRLEDRYTPGLTGGSASDRSFLSEEGNGQGARAAVGADDGADGINQDLQVR